MLELNPELIKKALEASPIPKDHPGMTREDTIAACESLRSRGESYIYIVFVDPPEGNCPRGEFVVRTDQEQVWKFNIEELLSKMKQ